MKRVNKSYKFRLYPTEIQRDLVSKHFGCVRKVYNHFLALEKETHEKTKKFNWYYTNANQLPELKKEYEYLKEVNSASLQHSLKALNQNIKFCVSSKYKTEHKFPKFKSYKNHKQSFKVPVNTTFKIIGNRIFIPKFKEGIKIKGKPNFVNPTFLNVTISKDNLNHYYASVQYVDDVKELKTNSKAIGLDLGIKEYATSDNGIKYSYEKVYIKKLNDLKILQQKLSRKKKGSNNYKKANFKLSKLHKKIKNKRHDYLHKLSSKIISENQVIIMENLKASQLLSINPKGMNRHISDSSFGLFLNMLNYKANWTDRIFIKVNPAYTSKTCNKCGYIYKDLQLSEREWTCDSCGSIHDRDINAAKNILMKGFNSKIFKAFSSSERAISMKFATLDETSVSKKEAIHL